MLTRPGYAQFIALVFVLLPAFSAGAPPLPCTCVLLLLTGLLLLLFRPAAPLPRSLTYVALALVLGSALAFLPVAWFGRAEWRSTLESFGDIALGKMVTPQPWQTLQGLAMMFAGFAFGMFLLCQPVDGKTHARLAGAFSLGVGAFAGFAIYAACTKWHHPWDEVGTFGFLPNRNHVGTLLAMGAAAGLGPFWNYLENRRWAPAATLGAALILTVIATLNFCESRAASLLLFAGFFIWLAGVFHRGIDRNTAKAALGLILFALLAFVTSQTPAMQRLKQTSITQAVADSPSDQLDESGLTQTNTSPSLDFRLLLYQDTWRMIADHPLTGIGLGNYRYISQQYRDVSLSQAVAIHSDSSWILIAAEAGLPTAAAAVVLVGLAFRRLRRRKRDPSWSVRWASATAVILFVGHCAVDVPAHRVATLLPALFLAGLAFRQSKAHPPQPCLSPRVTRVFFVVSGAAFIMAGAWLGGWIPGSKSILPTDEIEKAPKLVYSLQQQKSAEAALNLAENFLTRTPLDAELYFQSGILELTYVGTEKDVEHLFAIERALEPHLTSTPLRQAVAWLQIDPQQSLHLFADAMERAQNQDKRSDSHCAQQTLATIMRNTAKFPDIADQLYPLTNDRPDLLILWSKNASTGTFQLILQKILAGDPSLDHWNPDNQRELLRIWWQKGDRAQMQNLLHEHPSLENTAWPIFASDLAHQAQYEQAWRNADLKLHLDTLELMREQAPPSSQLRAVYYDHKTAIAAENLAKALFKERDFTGVLKLAEETRRASLQSPNLLRIASVAATRLARWSEAWAYLAAFGHAAYPELGLQ